MSFDAESIPPLLPQAAHTQPSATIVDAQALQNYLAAMQSELSNQLRTVHQRLDAVAPHAHEHAASFHPDPSFSPSPPVPSSSPPIPPSRPSVSHEVSAAATLSKLLSRPSQFHGEHGNRVYDWLSELDITFDNIGTATEHQKITFARQCLRDEALRWWIAREQEVEQARYRVRFAALGGAAAEPTDAHQTKEITSWSEFKRVFTDYFCPRGASEAARNQLHALRQNQFRDLSGYCDRFETVARRITTTPGHDITDELIATFKNGLSDGRIRLHLTTSHPSSLFEATRQAMQAESDLRVSNYGVRDNRESRPFVTGRPPFGTRFHGSSRPTGWNHGPRVPGMRYSSSPANSFHHRSPAPMGSSRDTSAPMELGVVEVDEEDAWEVASPASSEKLVEDTNTPIDQAEESDDHVWLEAPADEQEQEANFITRERRSSDRSSWQPNRSGDYKRGRSSTGESTKQQFARKNTCWNCGKVGHFLVNCPFQKGPSTSAMIGSGIPSSAPKPSSKKF